VCDPCPTCLAHRLLPLKCIHVARVGATRPRVNLQNDS